jgi:integral membrane protein (TIGR00529 family)
LIPVPAIAKIIVILFTVMLLNRWLPMFGCLLVGSTLIGLWMGMDIGHIADVMWTEFTTPTSLWLSTIIVLILFLSHLLTRSKQMDRISGSIEAVSPSRRFTVAAMPALIGLLPMPGGALFSAPMVETALPKISVKPEIKVVINYWFRHIWEYWWPLYPGVILGISVFGLEPWKMIAYQSPLTIAAVLAGVVFLLNTIPDVNGNHATVHRSDVVRLILETMPIWITIVGLFFIRGLLAATGILFDFSFAGSKYVSFVLALILAILVVVKRSPASISAAREALSDPKTYYLAVTIAAVMGFKGVLIESHIIEQVKFDLAAYHVPPIVIIVCLPFLAGVITGIAIGFVGASFPLVVTLVPEGASPYAYAMLAYGFGYLGMMLSPLHICFVVTKEYFSANMTASYSYLWKPVLLVAIWTTCLFLIYSYVHVQ